MFTKVTVVLILCFVFVKGKYEEDYYWLDYNGGPISPNALKFDANSNTYVGQVYTKQYELLPATIRTTPPIATSNAYDVTYTSNKNVKIVCSQFKKNFKWVTTNAQNYRSIPNLVPSGEEVGIPAFIGRAYENGKAYLGKIGKVLVYPVGPATRYTAGPFDVLTYNKPNNTYCEVYCES